jgi:hypothetical protein
MNAAVPRFCWKNRLGYQEGKTATYAGFRSRRNSRRPPSLAPFQPRPVSPAGTGRRRYGRISGVASPVRSSIGAPVTKPMAPMSFVAIRPGPPGRAFSQRPIVICISVMFFTSTA